MNRSRCAGVLCFALALCFPLSADTARPCRYLTLADNLAIEGVGGSFQVDIAADPSFFESDRASEYLTMCPLQIEPDDYELTLPPGDYALVYRNSAANTKYAVYVMSRWQ
jgi:hypothetical protein